MLLDSFPLLKPSYTASRSLDRFGERGGFNKLADSLRRCRFRGFPNKLPAFGKCLRGQLGTTAGYALVTGAVIERVGLCRRIAFIHRFAPHSTPPSTQRPRSAAADFNRRVNSGGRGSMWLATLG